MAVHRRKSIFVTSSPSLKSPITFTQVLIFTYFAFQGKSFLKCAFWLLNSIFDNDLRVQIRDVKYDDFM